MSKDITGNNTISSDFMRVIMAVKQNIMRDTNVAEICKVEKVDNNNIVVSLINNQSLKLFCTKLANLSLEKDDIVLVVFTNTDYRINLSKVKNHQPVQQIAKSDYHSSNYGVVIGLIYSQSSSTT